MLPTFIGAFQFEEPDGEGGLNRIVEVSPIEQFARKAEQVVLMNIRGLDMVRFFRLARQGRDCHPPLAVACAARPPSKEVPSSADLVRYYGPPGGIPRVSAYQVLSSSVAANESRFKGKVVVIGNALEAKTGLVTKDTFLTPTSSLLMSGVEIHATVVGNIMQGDWIRRVGAAYELLFLSIALVVITVALAGVTPFIGALFSLALIVVWSSCAYCAFLAGIFLPGVVACAVFTPLIFVVVTLVKHSALRVHLAAVQDMLGLGAGQ